MPSHQPVPSYRTTYYVRLRGANTGLAITGNSMGGVAQAKKEFARIHDLSPASPYITVCRKPTPGVTYSALKRN